MNYLKPYQILLIFSLLAITFFIFSPMISAKYALLDDAVMIRSPYQKALKEISFKNIVEIFKSQHEGLYHPIVTISYSIERTLFGFTLEIFHFDNIMLHLINIVLVFSIFFILSKSFWLSFLIAALFALHPTRVEVAVWLSARKDTLYSLFYLLSIFFYVKTYESNKTKLFISLSIFCFLLSCFSKAMAITLPFVLILIDFYTENFNKDKIKIYLLYFLFSVLFIIAAIKIHYTGEYTRPDMNVFTVFVNFINSHFNMLFYFDKFFLPVKLYCMYPFFYNRHTMPPNFILYSPCILYFIILVSVISLKKTKVFFYGLLFFLITMVPTSGVLRIGDFAVADRYTYIPYIGLFFIVSKLFIYTYEKFNKYVKTFLILLTISVFTTFCYLSYERTLVWKANKYGPPVYMKYYSFGSQKKNKRMVAVANSYLNKNKAQKRIYELTN